MKLQEFMEWNDKKGFVELYFNKMISYIELCKSSAADENFEKSREYMRYAENYYNQLYGYINAVYAYGNISFEDRKLLEDELMGLFEFKK